MHIQCGDRLSANLQTSRQPLCLFQYLLKAEVGRANVQLFSATLRQISEAFYCRPAASPLPCPFRVLPLDNFDINENNVTRYTKFITNIGFVLKPHYESFLAYSNEKSNAIKDSEKARLSIEDGQVRYQVKSELWEKSSLDFNEFIDWLKQKNTNR